MYERKQVMSFSSVAFVVEAQIIKGAKVIECLREEAFRNM